MKSAPLKSVNTRIFRALLSLSSAALLVRVAGMLNQVVVTARFGAGPTMDAYFVASTTPLLLAALLVDAMEASIIPIYTAVRLKKTHEQTARFFCTLLNLLLLGALLIALLMILFGQQFVFLSAPALDGFRAGLAIELMPLLAAVFPFMVVLGFLECVLNAEGQFGWPAYAGILVPLSTAVLTLLFNGSVGIAILALGMLAGLALQLVAFIVRTRQAGIIYRFALDIRIPEMKAVVVTAWPALLAAIITQALPFADQVVASFLSPGSISALNYASKIISVATSVIFVSIARAALPFLSRQSAANDMPGFKETLRLYLWVSGGITLVLMCVLLLFAHPIVRLLFQRGAFTSDDTTSTAIVLMGFTIGLVPMALGFLLAKAFSSLGKTKVLMGVTLLNVVNNAVFDVIFAHFWQGFGIALATSCVYICSVCVLWFLLSRSIGTFSLLTPPAALLNVMRRERRGRGILQSEER